MSLRESWGKLPAFLSEEDLVLFPGGRAIDRDLAQKRLEEFNGAFEALYKKQIYWVLSDKGLRLWARRHTTQAVIPSFRNYVQKYMYMPSPPMTETDEEETGSKYVKYTSATLQDLINFLFQPKVGKYDSDKCKNIVASNIRDVVANDHFPPRLQLHDSLKTFNSAIKIYALDE